MADKQISSGTPFTVDGTNDYYIGGIGPDRQGVLVVHVDVPTAWSGSIVVKGRVVGSGAAPVTLPYKKHYLNGAAGDETFVTTAITGISLIEIPASALDVVLSNTHTSGAAQVTVRPATNG